RGRAGLARLLPRSRGVLGSLSARRGADRSRGHVSPLALPPRHDGRTHHRLQARYRWHQRRELPEKDVGRRSLSRDLGIADRSLDRTVRSDSATIPWPKEPRMVDKTELQLKAAETRLDAIERAIETLRKDVQTQSVGNFPQDVKTMKTRVDTLDTLVKGLGVQMVLKKDLSTANQLDANERDKTGKALELRLQAEAKSMADKQKKEAEAQVKAAEAQIAKIQAQVDKAINDSRFAVLESRLKAVESRPKYPPGSNDQARTSASRTK